MKFIFSKSKFQSNIVYIRTKNLGLSSPLNHIPIMKWNVRAQLCSLLWDNHRTHLARGYTIYNAILFDDYLVTSYLIRWHNVHHSATHPSATHPSATHPSATHPSATHNKDSAIPSCTYVIRVLTTNVVYRKCFLWELLRHLQPQKNSARADVCFLVDYIVVMH